MKTNNRDNQELFDALINHKIEVEPYPVKTPGQVYVICSDCPLRRHIPLSVWLNIQDVI